LVNGVLVPLPYVPQPGDAYDRVSFTVREAFMSVRRTCPEAGDLVTSHARVIVLRADLDPDQSTGLSSWSMRSHPGRIGISVPISGVVPVAAAANALVHEAIHSYLYILESIDPFYLDFNAAECVSVRSPWTGRMLPLPSFTHACLVWYGLGRFWDRVCSSAAYDAGIAESYRDRARQGFHAGELKRAVASCAPYWSPRLRDTIEKVLAESAEPSQPSRPDLAVIPGDNQKLSWLLEHGARSASHTGGDLLAHLRGTRDLLRRWGASEEVCNAGLFHSVYGTAAYGDALVGLESRPAVRTLLGEKAESLVYLFAAIPKASLRACLRLGPDAVYAVEDRFVRARVQVEAAQFRDLCDLTAANWLEQRDRYPAEFADSDRDLFESMAPYLLPEAQAELSRVYACSPQSAGKFFNPTPPFTI
jgi:hypothetical protein